MRPLPTSWKDITISTYLDISKIILSEKDDFEREMKLIAYLRGITFEEVSKQSMKKFAKDSRRVNFLNKLPEGIIKSSLKIKGKSFKVTILLNEITAEQFIDITTIAKGLNESDYINQIHYLLGVILIPVKRGMYFIPNLHFEEAEYLGYEKNGEWLKENMSFADAYPYFVFFCKLLKKYQLVLNDYLKKEQRRILESIAMQN